MASVPSNRYKDRIMVMLAIIGFLSISCCLLSTLVVYQYRQNNPLVKYTEEDVGKIKKEAADYWLSEIDRQTLRADANMSLLNKERELRQEELKRSTEQITQLAEQRADNLLAEWKRKEEKKIREDAISKSKSVIRGKTHEHLLPGLPGFKWDPSDVRFLGSPIDYVVFDGLAAGELRDIVLVEVKTGKSRLSKRERQVRDICKEKGLSWEMLRQD